MTNHQLKLRPHATPKPAKPKQDPRPEGTRNYYLANKARALRYDYGQVEEQHREAVQMAALEIRSRLKRTVEDMLEIGRQLNAVKAIVPGQFTNWLKDEFAMSISSANEFMNVARRFEEFSTIIVEMGITVVRLLAAPSVPDKAVAAVIAQVQATGKALKVREVKAIVKPFLSPKPKQLPGPVGPEPDESESVIDVEYTIMPGPEQDADLIYPALKRSLARKLRAAALRGTALRDTLTGDEIDRLVIEITKVLDDETI